MAQREMLSCPECGYPVSANPGEIKVCDYCGTTIQAITQNVTIPAPLFTFVVGAVIGMFAGPALIASTVGGSRWLERRVAENLESR